MLICPQDDFLLSHRQLRAEPQLSMRCVKSLRAWFQNGGSEHGLKTDGTIAYDKTKFIDTAGDLVSLVTIAKPPLAKVSRSLCRLAPNDPWLLAFPRRRSKFINQLIAISLGRQELKTEDCHCQKVI